jgi:hypothetical protein
MNMALSELSEYLQKLDDQYADYPPVMDWNPELCGDIDIRIDRDGYWYHEGTKFERDTLVQLFAKLLRKEGDQYFLVTPAEKLAINVECAPLVIVSVVKVGEGDEAQIYFTTNTDEHIHLAEGIAFRTIECGGQSLPCLPVRNDLDALIHRNVFYQLVALADIDEDEQAYLFSDGQSFYLPSP